MTTRDAYKRKNTSSAGLAETSEEYTETLVSIVYTHLGTLTETYTTVTNNRQLDTETINVMFRCSNHRLHKRTAKQSTRLAERTELNFQPARVNKRTDKQSTRLAERTELNFREASAGFQPARANKRTLTKPRERARAASGRQPVKLNKRTPREHVTAYVRPTGQYNRRTETELLLLLEEMYRVVIKKEVWNNASNKKSLLHQLYHIIACYSCPNEVKIKKYSICYSMYVISQAVCTFENMIQHEENSTKNRNSWY